jgi:hypothetical protein
VVSASFSNVDMKKPNTRNNTNHTPMVRQGRLALARANDSVDSIRRI